MGRGDHGNHRRTAGHYRWSDRKLFSSHGYVKLRVGRSHPLADPNGYAYEHLVVWVAAGNPRPVRGEVLHHKDGDKTNNRLDNLEVLKRGVHNREHNQERQRDERGRFLPEDR